MKLRVALLWILGALAWAAGGFEVRPAASVQAAPGSYATLLFSVWGQGSATPKLLAPEGWPALLLPDRLELAGKGLVAVTVRVPELVPAGSEHAVVLQLWSDDRLLSQAAASVAVLPKTDLILYLKGEKEAPLGEPAQYRVAVVNRGNRVERVRVSARANTGEAYLRPSLLTLAPGEEGTATLTLQIGEDRQVSPGYTMVTWVHARAEGRDHERRARLTTRWIDPLAASGRGPDPTLRFALSGSVGTGVRIEAGKVRSPVFSYSLQPGLSGALSDYVATEVQTAALSGRSPSWWPSTPGNATAGFRGDRWDAVVSLSERGLGLQTAFEAGRWRYSVGARGGFDLDSGGASFGMTSTDPELDLQIHAGTGTGEGGRQDRLSLDYRLPLHESTSLRLGGQLSGVASDGYTVVASLRQGLVWQNERFSVLQSFSASPQLELYTLTLTGGSRNLYPVGLRTTAHLQSQPEGLGWKSSASLFAAPLERTSLRLNVTVAEPAGEPLEWTLNPSFGFRPPVVAGLRSSFSLGYKLRYAPFDGTAQQTTSLATKLNYGDLDLDASGSYTLAGDPGYALKLNLGWRPLPLTVLRGRFQTTLAQDHREAWTLSWQQYWGAGFATQMDLQRATTEEAARQDSLSLFLAQKSLGDTPFGLLVGYTVSDEDGLGHGSPALTQTFSLQLGYNFAWDFATPEAVVGVFGGRREGRVAGTAFVDENLNGVRDAGEPPVPGLQVALGNARATTDAAGRYELRVRRGTQRPRLADLPATLDLYRPIELEVKEGERYTLDLPLAPTAQVPLVLFHDANRNGEQDPGENGIAYGAVRLEGPVVRSFRTDPFGRTLATGLLPGVYEVVPDPELLPPRFAPTAPPLTVELRPGKADLTLHLGAAPPPKQVRTTYSAGKLSVFATLPVPAIAAGAEVEVRAIAQGNPETVWVAFGDHRAPLEPEGNGRYSGRLRLDPATPLGPQILEVYAARGDERAKTTAVVTVVERPLYELSPAKLQAGADRTLTLQLLFKAETVHLAIGEDTTLTMESADGYRWTAAWAPQNPGDYTVVPVADGTPLSTTRLVVLPRPTGQR